MNVRSALVTAVLLLAALHAANAQSTSAGSDEQASAGRTDATMAVSVSALPGAFAAQFIGVQQDYAGAVVAGAPYSGHAVTESVQMLHDGNRIRQRNEARLYRDSEGRTRRDQELNTLGAWQLAPPASPLVFIHDPVAGEGFLLDLNRRTARRLDAPAGSLVRPVQGGATLEFNAVASLPAASRGAAVAGPTATFSLTSGDISTSTEDLGERHFEGVAATGSLTRMTIAARVVGNELPIEVVTERWYSPALQAVVLRRHSDPRFGETTYSLTNISTDEPDPALFVVPDDFTIVQ